MLTILGYEYLGQGTGNRSYGLTIPEGTKAILYGHWWKSAVDFAVELGGVALTSGASAASNSAKADVWYLEDISGRSDDTLDITDSDSDPDYDTVTYVGGNTPLFWEGTSGVDAGSRSETHTAPTNGGNLVSVHVANCYDGTYTAGYSTTEVHKVGAGSGPAGIVLAKAGAVDTTLESGYTVTNDWLYRSWAMVTLYESEPIFAPPAFGIEVGFNAPTFTVGADVGFYPAPAFGIEVGFREGARFRAAAVRRFMLFGGGIETPEEMPAGVLGQTVVRGVSGPEWGAAPAGGADGSLVIDTSVSGATDVDRDDAATHDLTLTGDATLTPVHSDPTAGDAIDLRILIRQDGTGGWALAWGGTIDWVGGSAPTMPQDPAALLTVGLLSVDDGSTWLGYVADLAGGGTPATTVEDETTWGITPAVGTDTAYARQDHTHGTPAQPSGGGVGELLISDTPSTPLVFADLIQNEAQDDLVYADL